MLKPMVEITTLRNRSSAQDVRSSNGFSDAFYSSVLSQFLTICSQLLYLLKASRQVLNQLRNGISQDVRVNTLLQCVLV